MRKLYYNALICVTLFGLTAWTSCTIVSMSPANARQSVRANASGARPAVEARQSGPVAPVPLAKEQPSVTPYAAMRLAWEDARIVSLANDPQVPIEHVRYLSLHNFPSELRVQLKWMIDFTTNSLSTRRKIQRTAALPGNAPDPWVVRVNLRDYGISPANWDKLVEKGSGAVPLPDPYFHREIRYATPGAAPRLAAAEWLLSPQEANLLRNKVITEADTAIGNLIRLTNSGNPIVRADWFVYYAWVAPAYYELLGLPVVRGAKVTDALKAKEADFELLGRADLKQAKPSLIASIAGSKIVAQHDRILHRYPTTNGYAGGYIWVSNDTDQGVDKFDYMNNIETIDAPKVQAKELILTLLNTLQAYALVNGDLELINVAAANVAQHSDKEPTLLQDKQVYSGRNCVYCHKEGIYPISDKVRRLSQGKFALLINDQLDPDRKLKAAAFRQLSERIDDVLFPSVDNIVLHDQAIYTAAVKAANGMLPGANASMLEKFHWLYFDAPITLERAAWEVGWPVAKLDAALRTGVGLDYTVVGLLQVPPVTPSLAPWERQGHAQLMSFVAGIEAMAAQRGITVDAMLAPYIRK